MKDFPKLCNGHRVMFLMKGSGSNPLTRVPSTVGSQCRDHKVVGSSHCTSKKKKENRSNLFRKRLGKSEGNLFVRRVIFLHTEGHTHTHPDLLHTEGHTQRSRSSTYWRDRHTPILVTIGKRILIFPNILNFLTTFRFIPLRITATAMYCPLRSILAAGCCTYCNR